MVLVIMDAILCLHTVEKKRHSRMKRVGKAEDTVETYDTLVSSLL